MVPCRGHCKIGKNPLSKRNKKPPIRKSTSGARKRKAKATTAPPDDDSDEEMHSWDSASTDSQCSEHLFEIIRWGPGHDLESLWWLLDFCVFVYLNTEVILCVIARLKAAAAKTPGAARESPHGLMNPRDDPEFQDVLQNLFHDHNTRVRIFTEGGRFRRCTRELHESLWPIGDILEELRKDLLSCYENAEKDREAYLNPRAWEGFYGKFVESVGRIGELVKEILQANKEEGKTEGEGTTVRDEDFIIPDDERALANDGAEDRLSGDPGPALDVPASTNADSGDGALVEPALAETSFHAKVTGATSAIDEEDTALASGTPVRPSAKTTATSTLPVTDKSRSLQVGHKRKRAAESEEGVDTKRART